MKRRMTREEQRYWRRERAKAVIAFSAVVLLAIWLPTLVEVILCGS